jgi:hypothetical protein
MFAWFSSWIYWRSNPVKGPVLGPARNAPEKDDGRAIKAILAESARASAEAKEPAKRVTSQSTSPQVVMVSAADINKIRSGFRKVQKNAPPIGSQDPPLLREMNNALSQGHNKYFEQVRERRRARMEAERRQKLDKEMQALLLELMPKQVVSNTTPVSGPLVYSEDIVIPKLEITVIEHILAETVVSTKPVSEANGANEPNDEIKEFEKI